METRDLLVAAALELLEESGETNFSTRAVCALANVTAPTLYHHFGNADGLLSAAIQEAFAQFLTSKVAAVQSTSPEEALREGWSNYVSFAATRPRLYVVMLSRYLAGAEIPAAQQAFQLLVERVRALATKGRLALPEAAAADHAWASANAAALLHVTAQQRGTAPPDPTVIQALREQAMRAIIAS